MRKIVGEINRHDLITLLQGVRQGGLARCTLYAAKMYAFRASGDSKPDQQTAKANSIDDELTFLYSERLLESAVPY